MKILSIETSCDETSVAVVEDGSKLLGMVVNSQIDIHKEFGGVVPEVAARSHIEAMIPAVKQTLEKASCGWDDIDAIGATYAPGLIGSLMIGSLTARTLALIKNKPLYPVHHVEGHVYANYITEGNLNVELPKKQPEFPLLALIVSGGHSQLVLFRDHGIYELLGQTQDDAVGEAFDKVAKILGLPYPGGPSIVQAALSGDCKRYDFPKAKMKNKYDFSFSGLKTAVLRRVQCETGHGHDFPSHLLAEELSRGQRDDFAASFQYIAIQTLVEKTLLAYHEFSPKSVVIAGGVAANQELRDQLCTALPCSIRYAPMSLCTDNAAMIGSLAYYMSQFSKPISPYDFKVAPSLSMNNLRWR
jgi:N6-L-threonylcarbamoyladenine synthase